MKKHLKKAGLGMLAAAVCATTIAVGVSGIGRIHKTTTVEEDINATNDIVMHFKWTGDSTPHLYYSNINNTGGANMSYPGVPMKAEGNGWYSYTIAEADSADLVISVPDVDYETNSFGRTSGEYWYDDGRGWFTENPDADIMTADKKSDSVKNDGIVSVDTDASQVAAEEGITVHFVSDWDKANVYYWNAMPDDMETSWPGENMSKDDDGYYTYTFQGVSKINLLFTNGSQQTEDLTVKSGEWWYNGKKWSKKKPSSGGGGSTTEPVPFNKRDFREETIYFLMTTRFYDGDSSNNRYCWDDESLIKSETNHDPGWRGDFKGLIEKLDYIKALGFSAIWITPVVENASGLDYHGYHAYDFSRVDPRYESEDTTYQDLINACHEKGIRVIQDIVLNHTGNWGERNMFHMFDKDEDDGSSDKSAFMSVATDGEKAAELQKGVEMKGQGASNYDDIETNANIPEHQKPGAQYDSRLAAMKEDDIDTDRVYHHEKSIQWEGYTVQTGQMAGDCVDINTENPAVAKYLRECYINYINMGVDAFRIDTVKHITRLTFNKEFLPYFMEAGGDNFFMFGEACVRRHETFNAGIAPISVCFYTWKESKDYPWGDTLSNEATVLKHYNDNMGEQRTSDNAFLKGNEYHTPDRSEASGLDQIDFRMHWAFANAGSAFSAGLDEDPYFNDSTYNVTYVDSHDYAPDTAPEDQRFAGSQDTWAENLDLMFTFRGIPCIYYGTEIEFQKGCPIDPMVNNAKKPYKESGRAYFGDEIEGDVTASDFGVYSNASGKMADTLNHPLAKHIQRLNLIRRAVPALQKGQYSTEGCSGGISYKRRYTDSETDSFVCVTISGTATFSGVPSGTYVDMVSGDVQQCSGTLTANCSGKGNMRVYVLQTDGAPDGKIGEDGTYLK